MNLRTKLYITEEELLEAAKIGISNRLFVPTWCLRDELLDIIDGVGDNVVGIVIAFDSCEPVGIAYAFKRYSDVVEAWYFVRKKHRRKGIGTTLHKEIEKLIPDGIHLQGAPTNRGAESFFRNLGYEQKGWAEWRKPN